MTRLGLAISVFLGRMEVVYASKVLSAPPAPDNADSNVNVLYVSTSPVPGRTIWGIERSVLERSSVFVFTWVEPTGYVLLPVEQEPGQLVVILRERK